MEEKENTITDEKITKAIDFIKKHCNDYLVVGSIALKVCGLPLDREAHDIDVLVDCNNEQERTFKELDDINRNDTAASDAKCFKFTVCNIPINVWRVKTLPEDYVVKNSIKYGTVMYVIKEKMGYKREKDYKDLFNIVNNLLKNSY